MRYIDAIVAMYDLHVDSASTTNILYQPRHLLILSYSRVYLNSLVGLWNLDLSGEFDVSDKELIRHELTSTLQTTEHAATELLKGGAYTDESSSVVYYFYFDLCSRVSQTILNFKRNRDFYSEFDTGASSITQKLCGISLIIVLSVMVVFTIIFSISIYDVLYKQQVWIYSFLLGLLLDEMVNSSVVIMICDVLSPLCIMMTEVFDAKKILLDCIEKKKLSKQSIHHDLGIQPSAVAFNAADYFFVSKQLSSKVLPCSSPVLEVIGIYQSIAPKVSLSLNKRIHQWNELRLYSYMQTFSANACALSLKKFLQLHPLVQDSILHFFVSIIMGLLVIGLAFLSTIHSWLIPLLVGVIGMMIGAAFAYVGNADYDRRLQLSQHRALCFHENNKMSSASMTAKSVRHNIIAIHKGGDDSQPSRVEADEMIINSDDGGDSLVPLRNNRRPAMTLRNNDRPVIALRNNDRPGMALRNNDRTEIVLRGNSRPAMEINTMDNSITLFERSLLLFEWSSRIQTLSAECSLWPMSPRFNMVSAARKYDIEEGVTEAQRSKKYATDDEKYHQFRRDLVGLHTIEEYDVFALSDSGESKPSIYLFSDSDDYSIPLSADDKAEEHRLDTTTIPHQRSDSISLSDRGSSIVLRQSVVSDEVKDPKMDFDSDFGDSIDLSSSDDDDDDRSIPLSSSSDDDDSIELSSSDGIDSIFLGIIDDDNDDEGDNRSIELSSSSSDDSYT